MRQEMKSTSKRGAGGSTVTNMQDKNKVHKRDKRIKKSDKSKKIKKECFKKGKDADGMLLFRYYSKHDPTILVAASFLNLKKKRNSVTWNSLS